MPPTSVSLASLRTFVAQRLGDLSLTFWTAAEIDNAIYEALNYVALTTGTIRARFTTSLPAGASGWIDLATALGPLRQHTVTYGTLVSEIERDFLQPVTGSISSTSRHISGDVITAAIYNRRNLLVASTSCTSAIVSPTRIAPPHIYFDSSVVRIHRLVHRESRSGHTHPIYSSDEYAQYLPGELSTYSTSGGDFTEVRILPFPATSGTFEAVVTATDDVPPVTSTELLNVPDELAWAIKWGAISELLSTSNDRADIPRSQIADMLWKTGLINARMFHPLLTAYVNGRVSNTTSIDLLDAARPGWDGRSISPYSAGHLIESPTVAIATHQHVVIAGHDRSKPVSLSGTVLRAPLRQDPLPILNDIVEPLLAVATAFAAFKQGGAEAIQAWEEARKQLPFADITRRDSPYESVMLDNPRKPGRNPIDNALSASDESSLERRTDSH